MTISLKHAFTSAKSDGSDATLVQPSNWNAEHAITMATSRILGRKTASTGAVEELTADDVYDLLGIIATTAMLFNQTSAPTGWTKSVTHNDKALRVVSGSVSSGGATAYSSVFGSGKTTGSYTLLAADIPAHTHGPGTLDGYTSTDGSHTHEYDRSDDNSAQASSGSARNVGSFTDDTSSDGSHSHGVTIDGGVTGSTGGGGSHSHTLSLDLQYVDVIIATKD